MINLERSLFRLITGTFILFSCGCATLPIAKKSESINKLPYQEAITPDQKMGKEPIYNPNHFHGPFYSPITGYQVNRR